MSTYRTSTIRCRSLLHNVASIHPKVTIRRLATATEIQTSTSSSETAAASASPSTSPPPSSSSSSSSSPNNTDTLSTSEDKSSESHVTSSAPIPKNVVKKNLLESMPFQAYQLALKVIHEAREENLALIKKELARIDGVKKRYKLGEKDQRIIAMRDRVEYLKVQADINNPRVRYNFQNGDINMDKPVYRYMADKEWRKMRRPVLMQRLTTMNVIPDVLPDINPVVEVEVRFGGKTRHPGDILPCLDTEGHPTVKIKPFKAGEMLCTIAVIDPDVPDAENNTYKSHLHWLVSNIPINQNRTQAIGTGSRPGATVYSPYLPPHVQMGLPYHRYCMVVFKQDGPIKLDLQDPLNNPESTASILDAAALANATTTTDTDAADGEVKRDAQGHPVRQKMKELKRDTFYLRSFQDKYKLSPIGAFLWRGVWDEGTKDVMKRNNLPGWDVRFERNRP